MQLSAIYKLMGGDGEPTENFRALYKALRRSGARATEIQKGQKQYYYDQHDVTKPALRPDKMVFKPTGDKHPTTGEDVLQKTFEPPARIPFPFQQYIIKQKASFAAGSGVKLRPSDEQSQIFKDVYRNWYDVKADFFLRDIAKYQMIDTQVAVIFFGTYDAGKKKPLDRFSFEFMLVGPSIDGSLLEPFFDNYRRLVALGREYEDPETQKTVYELYIQADPNVSGSKPILLTYRNGIESGDVERKELPYHSIPIIYWEQDTPECDSVDVLIRDFEFGFSDFVTQMGYSADPILFGKGKVINLPAKGSAGKFIEGSEDSDLKYVTPDNATETRKLQFELMQKYIFSLSRSVLLDLDTMQSLSEVSGAALDRYLIDAYMEATDRQQGSWGLGIQRMVNWLVGAWKDLRNLPDDETTIDVSFTKYRVEDVKETVEMLLLANGGRPLISHEASVSEAGLADDPAVEFNRILEEEKARQELGIKGETNATTEAKTTNPSGSNAPQNTD